MKKIAILLMIVLLSVVSVNIEVMSANLVEDWDTVYGNQKRTNSISRNLSDRYQIKTSKKTGTRNVDAYPIVASNKIFLSLSPDHGSILDENVYFSSFDTNTLKEIKKKKFNDLFWFEYTFNDNSIFTQLFGKFVRFSSETFEIEWEHKTSKQNRGSHVLFDDKIVYEDAAEKFVCIDINTGKLLWETDLEFGCCYLAYNNKRVFVEVGNSIACINADNGETLWITEYENYEYHKSFILTEKYILLSDHYQTICFDQITGKEIYRKKDYYADSYLNGIAFGTSIVGDKFFLSSFDVDSGKIVWICDIDHEQIRNRNCFGSDVLSSLNNVLYVPSIQKDTEEYINCFTITDVKSGNVKQMLEIDVMGTFFSPIPYGDSIYLITNQVAEDENIQIFKLDPASDTLSFQISSNKYTPDDNSSVEMDSEPIIKNGRTLLPARYVTEPLGGQVFWDGEERKVTCKLVAPDNHLTEEYKENIVELWIGKPTAKINGQEVQIDEGNPDVVPTIINDRTMVPMRFLAESLGCEVEWVAETKEIILTYPNE